MSPLLRRSSRRYWGRHPFQTLLAVAGVAAGVAVVLAVDLANDSAQRAFRLSAEAVTGKATHQVVAGPGGLPEELFARLVRGGLEAPAAPVVEETVNALGGGLRSLRLLGIDPVSEAPFRASFDGIGGQIAGGVDLGAFLTRPEAVVATRETALGLGVEPGDRFPILTGGLESGEGERWVELVGLLEPQDAHHRLALQDTLVADIATAQELLDWEGRLSRIDLLLPRGDGQRAALERVRRILPEGQEILTAASRTETILAMTEAFRLNLKALSLLALLCGAFLVFNTARFSVVQRRHLLGRLRALGVTGREVFRLVVVEAAFFGLLGSVLGSLLGVALATVLVRLVTRTINDLYFAVTVRELAVEPGTLLTGLAVGMVASLLAAWPPAKEAAASPPRSTLSRQGLEASTLRRAPRLARVGLFLFTLGALLLIPAGSLAVNFLGILALLLGFAAVTPFSTLWGMKLLTPGARRLFGAPGAMAVRGVTASLSRTGVAIAALALAVAVTVGVGAMIDSFRTSVSQWLEHTLSADLYASSVRLSTSRRRAPFGAELGQTLSALEGIDGINTVRRVELETGEGRLRLAALDLDPRAEASYRIMEGDGVSAWRSWREGRSVLVSEPFAFHHGLGAGDRLELPGEEGSLTLPIVGVFMDYGSEQGLVLVHRSLYDRLWEDDGFDAISLYLEENTDPKAALDRARRVAAGFPGLVIRSNGELKSYSLEVFDRTFLITGVLRLLAGGVAFLGVLGALSALQLERRRELGVLRATGWTPRQVRRLVVGQTGLMGLTAGLLSLPLGLLLAWVMVKLINRRSFGWTLELSAPPGILLQALLLALTAAFLAGILPARTMASTPPAQALRGE